MKRCLNERALLRIFTHEGTAREQFHLRLCADCAERYDLLEEDLEAIGQALTVPPQGSRFRRMLPRRVVWMPAAIACAALAIVVLDVAWLQRSSPKEIAAQVGSVSAFAADLSTALFATSDANPISQLAAEAPYLEAALEAGQPCTGDRFFSGECNDQLSAFLIEDD